MTLVTQTAPVSSSNGVGDPSWLCLNDDGSKGSATATKRLPFKVVNNMSINFYNLEK
jgi:hypothetical protein